MKILLTGSNGQLGHNFKKIFDQKNIKYIATDYKELDITNDEDLKEFFQENEGITHIINCAAYNDVDKAETDKKVWLLNAEDKWNLRVWKIEGSRRKRCFGNI